MAATTGTKETKRDPNKKNERYIQYALVILAVLLIVLFIFFYMQYETLRRQQLIDAHEMHLSQLLERHAPLPLGEATVVRSWMTFDYINKLFALPPDYLQQQLKITDSHYPKLSIASYVKADSLNEAMFLGEVEQAITDYPAPEHATSTSL